MNKRARLARRILKDHRRPPYRSHWSVVDVRPWGNSMGNWYCPHCLIVGRVKLYPEQNKAHIPTYYGGGREQTRSAG